MSEHLRALRPRRSLLTKKQHGQVEIDEAGGDGTSLKSNESQFEMMADGTIDDSDSEPKLVIKEEPEDNDRVEEKSGFERKYKCNSCKPPNEFISLTDYLQHLKEQHQQKSKSHACQYCNYSYQNPKKLQRHILTAHKDVQGEKSGEMVRRNRCTMCNFVAYTPTDMENHQRLHHLKRRFFRCTKCSYMTHVRARYTKHVKYHSMPMIKCHDCDFQTPYKWNLDRHTRNHGGGGPFQCRACNFTAEIRQSLTVHETNHHEPPISQMASKMSSPFERKPRNSPKRYNQVGASDYRDVQRIEKTSPSPPIVENPLDLEEAKNAIDGADCIALKCEEKGCQFITAWDSEMQRHLAESHAGCQTPSKRKPLPMLIPLSPDSKSANNVSTSSSSPTTVLNVPRVRVRPELAKIARDTEIAKLYNNSEANGDKEASPPSNFEKRNASFFDKLKERLMTTSTSSGMNNNQVAAVSNVDDLKCWCTFKASSPDEMSSHKKTHHTALSVSLGVSRCPKCRRRCKTSSDLQMHIKICSAYNNNNNNNNNNNRNSSQENTVNSDSYATTSSSNDFELPLQVDWDANYSGLNSSGSSVDGVSTSPTTRRVFKCPHCPFWASTASRFHVHIVGHLNRKPFECSLCAYRSNWRWDITKHIKLKAARDPAHLHARVLMTDETGRRNYSKYNKYLTQLEHQGSADLGIDETQGGLRSGEPPRKILVMSDSASSYSAGLKRRTKTMNSLSIDVTSSQMHRQSGSQVSRTHGQSLLKINPSTSGRTPHAKDPLALSPSKSTPSVEDTKRTLWKCKRCNYRDSSKEVLLLHVKSHYEKLEKGANDKAANELTCTDCPYVANDSESLAIHKVHHRPNLEAIFKCYLCPYYVSTKAELLDHARLHGEELAVVHQSDGSEKAKGAPQNQKNSSLGGVRHLTPPSGILISGGVGGGDDGQGQGQAPPPLLLDTRALPDTPMVWVSRPDGIFAKMFKCRHCPHVSSRRAEVRDHETMHINDNNNDDDDTSGGVLIACPDCSFTCTQRDVMESHANMHLGSLGTVHCLVADNRSDAQQLDDLKSILGLAKIPTLGPEPDLRDSRLVHNCAKCPARFLCEKELRIHLRYHSTSLAYTCEWCSYAARQPAHLLAHQKAHSSEYQERTRYLSSVYGNSQRYPPPMTACVEVKSQITHDSRRQFAWIVVEVTNSNQPNNQHSGINEQKGSNQVFTCVKCPARYFKLDALEYHMTLHGSNNRFKCEECDYSSKTAQNLMKHQVVHRRQPDTIEQPKEQVQARLQPPTTTTTTTTTTDPQLLLNTPGLTTGNPNFVYPAYVRNGKLKEKKYKCHKCPSAFEKREQYRIHLSLHGSKQKYRCDKCDYAVKYYANYVQHLKKHQANAEAQASRRQMEIDNANFIHQEEQQYNFTKSRRKSTTGASAGNSHLINISCGEEISPVSNQDRQTIMLMQRKASLTLSETDDNALRCLECPFSAADQALIDAHKRRHGIERLTPPCPHCNYVPRKDENLNEHIRLHFTRMYKPEGYLIIEMLSLKMEKHAEANKNHDKDKENHELLFSECSDGNFLPITDIINTLPAVSVNKKGRGCQEKVVIDANTGDATHRIKN